MLPVLVRFEGNPVVDSNGRILYEFERLPTKPKYSPGEVPVSWGAPSVGRGGTGAVGGG